MLKELSPWSGEISYRRHLAPLHLSTSKAFSTTTVQKNEPAISPRMFFELTKRPHFAISRVQWLPMSMPNQHVNFPGAGEGHVAGIHPAPLSAAELHIVKAPLGTLSPAGLMVPCPAHKPCRSNCPRNCLCSLALGRCTMSWYPGLI